MLLMVLSLFGFYGVISNDTIWSDTAYLSGDVLVKPGVTLTIAPGTVVLYADTCEWDTVDVWSNDIDLKVDGNLRATGSENDSILFRCTDENPYVVGYLYFESGWDSLCFCSFEVLSFKLSGSEAFFSSCRFERGGGIQGQGSRISLRNSKFSELGFIPLLLRGGTLLVDSSSFFKNGSSGRDYGVVNEEKSAVIWGENLDFCKVRNTQIKQALGISPSELYSGGDCSGCRFVNCEKVEISYCIFDSIRGGYGGDAAMGAPPAEGGDGLAIYLESCRDVTVSGNEIVNIVAGRGGKDWENGGYASSGASRPLVLTGSSPTITTNEFNSGGTSIFIDSTSHPIIGGASGKGNRFLKNQGYVICNYSPYDIDATWNFWSAPSLIDSLIFDYYDDSTKGIVHYDNYQGVEEEHKVAVEPFSVGSTIAHDVLTVSFASDLANPVRVDFFDASGRKVLSQPLCKSRESIDVSCFSRGVYFVTVKMEEGTATKKVVIR